MSGELRQCDILVAGGGIAGVCAALAAARNGAEVILCQDRPMLGGNASSEIRMHVCGADESGGRGSPLLTEAREGGIVEEIRLRSAVENPQCSATQFDLLLYDLCRSQPRLRVMLNTVLKTAAVRDRRVDSVLADQISTDRRFRIESDYFIDATGDADLAWAAGAACLEGDDPHERRRGDSAKPPARKQGSSLLLTARRHDRPMPFTPPSWARKITEADLRLRPHATAEVDYGLEYGFWWLEWGGLLDTIADNERIRDELLSILMGVWDHIKNGGEHGADNWALEWTGWVPGKRESRRVVGRLVLQADDLRAARPFEDGIAYGGWQLDVHPPEGFDGRDLQPCIREELPRLYEIPLRACLARDFDNLLMAGRNISASQEAFASTRVMGTCGAVGQGVGTAAALAAARGLEAGGMPGDAGFLAEVRRRLLRQDALVLGALNEDPDDLARNAVITASSEQPRGRAGQAVSGQTRALQGPRGARPERCLSGTHRWMSDPSQGFPAELIMEWPEPVAVDEVQLIFDTGMHRPLTLTHSLAYRRKMQWGPQPETARDYTIEIDAHGDWLEAVSVTGNFLRRRVHRLPAGEFRRLRLRITAANGLDHARLCEIRLYPQASAR